VIGSEEVFRVLLVRKAVEARIPVKVARRPFPHVSDHSVAAERGNVLFVSTDGSGIKGELIDVSQLRVHTRIAPREDVRLLGRWIPRSCDLPLEFRRQALPVPLGKSFCLVVADVANGACW